MCCHYPSQPAGQMLTQLEERDYACMKDAKFSPDTVDMDVILWFLLQKQMIGFKEGKLRAGTSVEAVMEISP